MAWVKIDDNAPHHRKQLAAGPLACWLWVCGLAYCQKHATDGLIPGEAVPFLGVKEWQKAVPALLKAGLWVADAPSGYRVHDFLHWNDSAAMRREKIAESAERVARYREGRRRVTRDGNSVTPPPLTRDGNSVTPLPSGNAGNGTPLPQPLPQPTPQPSAPSKNDGAARGPGLIASSLDVEKRKRFNAYVGARLDVPHKLHQDFMRALGGTNPDAALRAWYADIDAEIELSGEAIIPDIWKWLEARFKPWATNATSDAAMAQWAAEA